MIRRIGIVSVNFYYLVLMALIPSTSSCQFSILPKLGIEGSKTSYIEENGKVKMLNDWTGISEEVGIEFRFDVGDKFEILAGFDGALKRREVESLIGLSYEEIKYLNFNHSVGAAYRITDKIGFVFGYKNDLFFNSTLKNIRGEETKYDDVEFSHLFGGFIGPEFRVKNFILGGRYSQTFGSSSDSLAYFDRRTQFSLYAAYKIVVKK